MRGVRGREHGDEAALEEDDAAVPDGDLVHALLEARLQHLGLLRPQPPDDEAAEHRAQRQQLRARVVADHRVPRQPRVRLPHEHGPAAARPPAPPHVASVQLQVAAAAHGAQPRHHPLQPRAVLAVVPHARAAARLIRVRDLGRPPPPCQPDPHQVTGGQEVAGLVGA